MQLNQLSYDGASALECPLVAQSLLYFVAVRILEAPRNRRDCRSCFHGGRCKAKHLAAFWHTGSGRLLTRPYLNQVLLIDCWPMKLDSEEPIAELVEDA